MKKRFHYLLFFGILASFSCSSANWVEGEAQMKIGSAPLDEIREKTIKNAIADASFRAGAMVSSEEILLNGILLNSKVVLQSQGMLRRAEVLSESIDNDTLTIRVRADIQFNAGCPSPKYARNILISQLQLLKPKQASIGGLFEISKHITKRIEQQLQSQYQNSDLLLLDKSFTKIDLLNGIDRDEVMQKASYLRQKYGYQYILFGAIRDLSTFNRITKGFLNEEVETRRNFTIRLYLLDVYHNRIVYEDSYHAEADWEFEINEIVDMNSSIFWQSAYGRTVLNTVSSALVDINDIIDCSNYYAQIVSRTEDGYLINIGERHGVKIGDRFDLNAVLTNNTYQGASYSMIKHVPNSQMQVIALDKSSALIDSKAINASIGANVFDLVSPAVNEVEE